VTDARRRTVKIAICVATYRRPVMLRALLDSLGRQTLDLDVPVELCIVVVDNDAAESARPVIDAARTSMRWPLHSAVEPVQNISRARNRAIAVACTAAAEWVAFIDDDEIASPRWIAELARAQRTYAADVVAGPVGARYPDGAPSWLVESNRLLARTVRRTGERIVMAQTGNVLVSTRLLGSLGMPFDPAFGCTGGGDSHLFLRARLAGARMSWAAEATVVETVLLSRTRIQWVVRRAFRIGNCSVFVDRAVLPPTRWLPRRLAMGVARVALGVGLLLSGLLRGRGAIVGGLWQLCQVAGSLAGVLGLRYVEYTRVHGE